MIYLLIGDRKPTSKVLITTSVAAFIDQNFNKYVGYIEKRCIVVIIAQTTKSVGVKNLNGLYSYPVRLETGLYKRRFLKII